MTDLKAALNHAKAFLRPTSPTPQLDAEVLLMHVTGQSRAFFYAHPEYNLTPSQIQRFQTLLNARQEGTPVAYLTGQREFWSLSLNVNSTTLIPRPETERLVEVALKQLKNQPNAAILDLGTGSGAIALALASEQAHWEILASDKSEAALQTAQNNLEQFAFNHVRLCCSDWFQNIPKQQFDAIVSNPPYLAERDPHLERGDLRFEPQDALVSGSDGLNAIRHIIQTSLAYLKPGGLLLLEHGFQQKKAVLSTFNQWGYANAQCWQDWQGQDRISGGWKKQSQPNT